MKQKVLITGANGQLGMCFRAMSEAYPEVNFSFTCKEDLDIVSETMVEEYVRTKSIDVIVNCAAYTAVDKAQSEPQKAYAINADAVEVLAKISLKYSIRLVHISTDYVFDGRHYKPYTEEDIPNAINVYGQSKQKGEEAILRQNLQGSIILRTSWLYSPYGNNFVKTMLRLGREKEHLHVVSDQIGAPTSALDLARAIMHMLKTPAQKDCAVYHYQNEGVLSWYDFAKEIMKMAKLSACIEPIRSIDYPLPAQRPYMSLLETTKIKRDFDMVIPYWKDSLKACLHHLL